MADWLHDNDGVLGLIFWIPALAACLVIAFAAFRLMDAWRRGEPLPPRPFWSRRPGRMRKRGRGKFGGR